MPEILVAVLIVTILVTMAVPMYERAVEKSRIAEVSATLKRMSESKLRVMDDRNMADYSSGDLSLSQLDSSIKNTSDFSYRLYPESFPNAVCAVRLKGDNRGTSFLYLGETAAQYCDDRSDRVFEFHGLNIENVKNEVKDMRRYRQETKCSGPCFSRYLTS